MEPLESKKVSGKIRISEEMASIFTSHVMDQWMERHLRNEDIPDSPIIVDALENVAAALPEPYQDFCDHCGKEGPTSAFSGWKHDPGEYDMLCDHCLDCAKVEE